MLTLPMKTQVCVEQKFTEYRYFQLIKNVCSSHLRDLCFIFISNTFYFLFTLLFTFYIGRQLSNIETLGTVSIVNLVAVLLCITAFLLQAYLTDMTIKHVYSQSIYLHVTNIISKILDAPVDSVNRFSPSDLNYRITYYEATLTSLIIQCISLVSALLRLILLMIVVAYFNMALMVICLVLLSVTILSKCILYLRALPVLQDEITAKSSLVTYVHQVFMSIHKIRSACAHTAVISIWLRGFLGIKKLSYQLMRIDLAGYAVDVVVPMILLITLYISLYLHWLHFSNETLILIVICFTQFSQLRSRISQDIIIIMKSLPGLAGLQFLSDLSHEQASSLFSPALSVGHLELRSLSYYLPNSRTPLLNNVSLQINAGSFVGIVGASGSGKSTLLRLLLGALTNYQGDIFYDKINIRHLDFRHLRQQVSTVLQSSQLFPGTIFSNLSTHRSLTLDEAWELAAMVGLDKEILAMPMNMFTYISDNSGESLSGGQRQKILIARALSTKPKILILDEATSALDNHSQAHIFATLAKLSMTRIVVAHRLSTLKTADAIYKIDHGHLVPYDLAEVAKITSQ